MASAQASSAAAGVARGPQRRGLLRHVFGWLVEHRSRVLSGIAAGSIVVGGALYLAGERAAGQDVWAAAVALLAAELAFEVVRTVIVDHHLGVDTIALVAMVGALALGEEFAGVIIGLMFSGGATLEDIASTRARRELTALIQRAPEGRAAARRRAARAGAGRRGQGGRRRGRENRRGGAGRRHCGRRGGCR